MMKKWKVIMSSGRVYTIDCKKDEKSYTNGWIYYHDENGDTIIGLRKRNVEAEIWDGQDEYIETGQINSN